MLSGKNRLSRPRPTIGAPVSGDQRLRAQGVHRLCARDRRHQLQGERGDPRSRAAHARPAAPGRRAERHGGGYRGQGTDLVRAQRLHGQHEVGVVQRSCVDRCAGLCVAVVREVRGGLRRPAPPPPRIRARSERGPSRGRAPPGPRPRLSLPPRRSSRGQGSAPTGRRSPGTPVPCDSASRRGLAQSSYSSRSGTIGQRGATTKQHDDRRARGPPRRRAQRSTPERPRSSATRPLRTRTCCW
jgi:hypothetical protein